MDSTAVVHIIRGNENGNIVVCLQYVMQDSILILSDCPLAVVLLLKESRSPVSLVCDEKRYGVL